MAKSKIAPEGATVDEAPKVPALIVTPGKAVVVSGNFEEIGGYLDTECAKYGKKMSLATAVAAKKEMQAYRTSLTKILTQVKKDYFNDPKSVFEAKVQSLIAKVTKVEDIADKELAKEDKKRIDDLTAAFDEYKAEFQTEYQLDDKYLARVEYRKQYFNKGAVEKESKDDILLQFVALQKEQNSAKAARRTVEQLCADDKRLNPEHWLAKLEYEDAATITESLISEKNRLRDLDKTTGGDMKQADTSSDGDEPAEKIIVGEAAKFDFSSDLPERTKKMRIEVEYPADVGPALSELFANLRKHGIIVRAIKEEGGAF